VPGAPAGLGKRARVPISYLVVPPGAGALAGGVLVDESAGGVGAG
jgi:hypothetical protein